jgi:hypothetical protein
VEVAVFRDRAPARVGGFRQGAPAPPAAEAPSAASGRDQESNEAKSGRRAGSYPGTGWGEAAHDPAIEVRFDAVHHPAERITLRYEYASALRALGILPAPYPGPDRLRERERGTGFARPPRW